MLESEILVKEEIIKEKEQILSKLQLKEENKQVTRSEADENDNIRVVDVEHPLVVDVEHHLEGQGQRNEINSHCPKLLRLQSVQVRNWIDIAKPYLDKPFIAKP